MNSQSDLNNNINKTACILSNKLFIENTASCSVNKASIKKSKIFNNNEQTF